MINDNVDAIVFLQSNLIRLFPLLKAHARKIPVILVDRKINSSSYTTYIGADNEEIGIEAANYILF